MPIFILLLTFLFISSEFALAESETLPKVLTRAEADAIVEAEMVAHAERAAERKAELQEVPASLELVVNQAGHRTIFRQVAPPIRTAEPAVEEMDLNVQEAEEVPAAPELKSMNLTLFVTVFDDELTEIRVAPLGDGVTVLSNIPFSHLPAIESLQTENVYYSFFSFVNRIESDLANETSHPDSTMFSSTSPEYVVFSKSETAVSSDLLEAMDVLHGHYLTNKIEFEARAQHAEALRVARERYLEENAPADRETTVNFWPIPSRINLPDSK